MRTRDGRLPLARAASARLRWSAVLGLALASQAGCGREFYREWANQDVSEAVFEKSRDPRWRFDAFSIEPPALARHSNPYDPDRPPAPPDDYATEQLSPVPQWPDNRLLVPAEGTGYLDMLEAWQRQNPYRAPASVRAGTPAPRSPFLPPITVPGGGAPAAMPLPAAGPSPFAAPPEGGANSGTARPPLSPLPLPAPEPVPPPPPVPPPAPATAPEAEAPPPQPGPEAGTRPRDPGVTIAAFQDTGLPMPVPPPAPLPPPAEGPPPRDVKPPPIGMDPAPNVEGSDLSAPVNPRPDQTPGEYRAGEAMASELAGVLVPGAIDFDEAEAAGLPSNSNPYVLTMSQAFTLALINSRVYQFQLENVYAASLAVTLQRFAFTPQFYAGLTPLTGVALGGGPSPGGGFALNLPNSFNYATRATGTQSSALTLGTVAGAGKLFNSGARVLAGFANQLVFNFVGHNSFQPQVKSFLPLTIVQPFLRGGGRAVTLEALTQAERSLVYAVRNFAKFRQEFTVATLTGGSVTNFGSAVPSLGFTGGGNSDPTIGFLNVLEDLQIVENDRRNIATYEQFVIVYRELIKGESSGLTQLQLDQVEAGLLRAKQALVGDRTQYRFDLDQFKMQMGLPPDTPLVPDRGPTRKFKETFAAVVRWQRNPRRELKDLPRFAESLPELEDVILDGRSVLGVYKEGNNDERKLEDVLLAGERLAMEHRLDLMNQRATLYDVWRQIKVTANALQGYFNVALTNQFVTPPNNTNPFGFVDQAKQFSVVINAELPLVRLAERNNFRASLINYERQRRSLMNAEDSVKLNVRQDIRNVQQQYLNYEIAKRVFVLQIRQVDQALEQIVAPPQQAGAAGGNNQAPALQTTNLINFQGQLLSVENQLVTNWYGFQLARLQLYRDLGTLPLDEWEAFHEIFPDEPIGGAVAPVSAVDAGPPGAGAARVGADEPGGPRVAKVLAVVATIAAVVAGVVFRVGLLGAVKAGNLFAAPTVGVITYAVRPANLPIVVSERGSLESSENKDAYCQVEGQTTIISIVPEGTKVEKGQVVCELDSSALKDALTNQVIATKTADSSYQQARLTREVAEIAVKEYEEGVYKQNLETCMIDIALAQSNLKSAEDRLDWSDRMLSKGYVSPGQNMSDRLNLQKAKYTLEQAQTKLTVLEKFTKDKTIKELRSDVEKTHSDELAKSSTLELEKTKEEKLKRQIANCKIVAPSDGLVVYANDPNRFGGSQQPQIEEGATVRERQKIFSLPDIDKMRVNTKVHESMVDRIKPGLRARVKVDAFAEETLPGTVVDVAPLPDPSSFFSSDVKVYSTHVAIEKALKGLRPGMTAQVEILVADLPDVLSVPVMAVLQFKGKNHVAIKKAEGFQWRDVVLGQSNDRLVEVKSGIKTGDEVALSPIVLMTEDERNEAFGSSQDPTKKDWEAVKAKVPNVAGEPGKDTPKPKAKRPTMPAELKAKFDAIPQEERAKLRGAPPEEQEAVLKKGGFTPEELKQYQDFRALMRSQMGGRGGGAGAGGPGGGGGFGGGEGGGYGGPGGGNGGGGGGGGGGFGGAGGPRP